ncbi:hypothetical protein [Streptomyces sp. NPDC058155]|uniref:hypothetical protein n=1 Tax=Streptomyces sp. NPDC058155 TaxID=3346359 RepID=UPI0036EDD966
MFKIPAGGVRTAGRSVLYAATGLVLVGLSVAAVAAGNFALNVWNGPPYPSTDPDTVAQRLKDRSDEVYDGFALPGKYPAESGRVDTGACYHRGLSGFTLRTRLERARHPRGRRTGRATARAAAAGAAGLETHP